MGTRQERTIIRVAPTPRDRASRAVSATWRMMRRNPNMFIGVVILTGVFLMAIFAPLIVRTDYTETTTDLRLAPSAEHWFGTDNFGRDVFDRVIVGSRISLYVGFAVTAISVVVGLVIALFAGYFRILDNRVYQGLW
jgi:ABC-type dipeptide/oligopeptide/nickel transport system permease subunit